MGHLSVSPARSGDCPAGAPISSLSATFRAAGTQQPPGNGRMVSWKLADDLVLSRRYNKRGSQCGTSIEGYTICLHFEIIRVCFLDVAFQDLWLQQEVKKWSNCWRICETVFTCGALQFILYSRIPESTNVLECCIYQPNMSKIRTGRNCCHYQSKPRQRSADLWSDPAGRMSDVKSTCPNQT